MKGTRKMTTLSENEFTERSRILFEKINDLMMEEDCEIAISTIFALTGSIIDQAKGRHKVAVKSLLLSMLKNLQKD